MTKIGEIVMDTKFSDKREYLLPDLTKPNIKKDILELEAYNSIQRLLPLTEEFEELLPENQRKKKLAAQVCAICYSLAGDFIDSQDLSVLDDYNFI